jgi:GT2 family glycosyltransferase
MSEPVVSVVIPNWNGRPFLERCLSSLREAVGADVETIVVDNASSDGSVDLIRERFPEVRVVAVDANRGFAGAVNAGARAARGRYLAILNNDTEVSAAWLDELVACLERHPRAASVASKVLRLDDRLVLDGAGDTMTWSLKAYRRGRGERDRGQYDQEEQVFSAAGTACLWRADVFRELGGFDESFFAFYEDVDLGFRARLAGYECWYAPGGLVYHAGHAAARTRWREFDSLHSVRNRWATAVKNAPSGWLLRNWHSVLAGETLSLGRSVAAGTLPLVLRAYGEAIRAWPSWRAERRLIQRRVAVPPGAFRTVVRETFPPARMSIARLREVRAA